MVRLSWQRSSGPLRGYLTFCQVSEFGRAPYWLSSMMQKKRKKSRTVDIINEWMSSDASIIMLKLMHPGEQPFVMSQGQHHHTVTAATVTLSDYSCFASSTYFYYCSFCWRPGQEGRWRWRSSRETLGHRPCLSTHDCYWTWLTRQTFIQTFFVFNIWQILKTKNEQ